MSRTITIATGAHLCRNPRVVKEATALVDAGFRVTVLGPALHTELMKLDEEIVREGGFTHEIAASLIGSRFERHWHRAVRRGAVEANARLGLQRPEALGYGARAVLRRATELDADLTIGHQEVGLWVVQRLQEEGLLTGVDLEDWYSEDLLPDAWVGRPRGLLTELEASVLKNAAHATTTSMAMSGALAERYGCHGPTPIYNSFPASDRESIDGRRLDRAQSRYPSLYWVSQTVGRGRGLEEVIAALRLIDSPLELHLRGKCSTAEQSRLQQELGSNSIHELHVHDLVAPGKLLSRTAEHDLGLALEPDTPLNTDLTISNKSFHYLQAGIPTVASMTKGQSELAELTGSGVRVFERSSPDGLANSIKSLLGDGPEAQGARASAWTAGAGSLSWECQAEVLVGSVAKALAN